MPLRFLNPNYHVILIHYPLGVFMLGVLIEALGFLWGQSSVRVAARWMILLGGLASLPAATSGIFALSDVTTHQVLLPEREQMLRFHTWLQSIASLLAVLTVVFGLAASDRVRRKAQLPVLIALLLCAGGMVAGSWFGGEMVYTQGVAVQDIKPATPDETPPVAVSNKKIKGHKLVYYTGQPVQLHMIVAGVTFALALASLGLSIRRITALSPDVDPEPDVLQPHIEPEVSPMAAAATTTTDEPAELASPAPRFIPEPAPTSEVPAPLPQTVAAGRWWLLASLVAVATIALGYWVWADGNNGEWSPRAFWEDFMTNSGKLVFTRAPVHVWVGVVLLLLTLLLAALSRWAPYQKGALSIFATLLVLSMAAQVWLGILLQFDQDQEGPLYRFTPVKHAVTSASSSPLITALTGIGGNP